MFGNFGVSWTHIETMGISVLTRTGEVCSLYCFSQGRSWLNSEEHLEVEHHAYVQWVDNIQQHLLDTISVRGIDISVGSTILNKHQISEISHHSDWWREWVRYSSCHNLIDHKILLQLDSVELYHGEFPSTYYHYWTKFDNIELRLMVKFHFETVGTW